MPTEIAHWRKPSNRLLVEYIRGLVESFVSSDPSPGGGLQPGGDAWFAQIQSRLVSAEAVWVLATPESIARPWIYWEAGMGRALCPNGVVVIRLNLAPNQVPSPLDQLQSYDGHSQGDDGIGVMLGKIANQIGMTLDQTLVDQCTKEWMGVATSYEPSPSTEGEHMITEENLNRLDSILARMESAITPASRPPRRVPRRQREDQDEAIRREINELGVGVKESADELFTLLDRLKQDWEFNVEGPDSDGDIVIDIDIADSKAISWLAPSALDQDIDESKLSKQCVSILEQAREILNA